MNFHILTLFPDMVMDGLGTSITGRAMESGPFRQRRWTFGLIQGTSTAMWMTRLMAAEQAW